ncbi:MAG: hypothetical protein EOO52_18565 [Gammaproteobacteria bacterium]|nr:MAG: hypothetical protein EOO52_18565 [Gammaproteobacteria bacterium]
MMKIKYVATIFLHAFIAASCAPKNPPEKPPSVLSDAQQHTLEKAKETEDILKKADEERRKKLDEMEGK